MPLKITIQTDKDFTPPGRRRAKIAYSNTRHARIRWYVGGRIYRTLSISQENLNLSVKWVNRE